jgi:tRNA pseudouridine55 synthase
MNGVLCVHKPKGPTSHDVVAILRRLTRTRRVGHTGTLDPMAEGVLVCCVGPATRIVPWLTGLPKEYTGEIALGASSNTYDAEGEITPGSDPSGVAREDLERAFRAQTGMIEQIAPAFSAVKVRGKKLYEYARKGEEVPERKRTVWIERFEVVRYFPPRVLFLARVGSGTYIRSMAHEVGRALGCGAYLASLCRTRVGGFLLENSVSLEALEADPDELLPSCVLTEAEALGHLPRTVLLPVAEARLLQGHPFRMEDVLEAPQILPVGQPILVCSSAGTALAIVQADAADSPYRPLRVFAPGV